MANQDKNRKSEAQERFEEADNAGRFAGNDEDARTAKQNALNAGANDTTGYDSSLKPETGRGRTDAGDDRTDREAHRNPAATQDYKGEAQNVNDDSGRPLNEEELRHASNKAKESKGTENSRS